MNDFHPQKSSVCVTAPSEENDLVSKCRTVKAMRAALIGVPIVSPTWILHCIENNEIVAPHEQMYIHTLPTKADSLMDDSDLGCSAIGGIFKLATINENIDKPFLFGLSVCLCGDGWKKSSAKAKDVQLLLKESGATLLKAPKDALKLLKQGLESGSTLVLLCDGAIDSVSTTFPQTLKQALEMAIKSKGADSNRILVVNSNWFFDCISCATILDAKQYEPTGSLAVSLWKSFMGS